MKADWEEDKRREGEGENDKGEDEVGDSESEDGEEDEGDFESEQNVVTEERRYTIGFDDEVEKDATD